MLAGHARKQRLADAIHQWSFAALTASPGARAYYDAHRTAGDSHHQALRTLSSRLVGILHGWLTHHTLYDENTAASRNYPQPLNNFHPWDVYTREGQGTRALRFGDPRAMALAGALCVMVHAVSGFTNKSLRSLVAGLLGVDYSTHQMTYDLRRLRLQRLTERLPRTNTYVTTPAGLRTAVFYTKVHNRILGPPLRPDHPPAPLELRRAMTTLDRIVTA